MPWGSGSEAIVLSFFKEKAGRIRRDFWGEEGRVFRVCILLSPGIETIYIIDHPILKQIRPK